MDNGHHNAIFSAPEVNSQEDVNLNENDWQKSLEISTPSDLPSPEQLSKTIENTPENPTAPEQAQNDPLELENPTPVNNQPTMTNPLGSLDPENSLNQSAFDKTSIRTTGDRLEQASLGAIDHAMTELNQTGNLSNFYDEIRSMTEVNLNNSFNRKLYQEDNSGGNQ